MPDIQMRRAGVIGFYAVTAALAAVIFAALAINVSRLGAVTVLDTDIANALHQRASPFLTMVMRVVTTLNSTVMIAIYTSLAVAHQAFRRQWRWAATLTVCVGGGALLNVAVKLAFHRARPVLLHPLLTLDTYSFPSGHAAGSTLFYSLFALWAFRLTARPGLRAMAAFAALSMVVLVSFSRLYLGVHFLSDVVAGCAEALTWTALCLLVFELLWRGDGSRLPP